MKKCKHCGERIQGSTHTCFVTNRTYHIDDDSDFLLSMVIGVATDSAITGGIIGGDIIGGIVGDSIDGNLFD